MRRKRLLFYGVSTAFILGGGIWSVAKSRPVQTKACCAKHAAAGAGAAHDPLAAHAPAALPPGHPDISGMAPVPAPALSDEQMAQNGGCPYIAKQKAGGAGPSKT